MGKKSRAVLTPPSGEIVFTTPLYEVTVDTYYEKGIMPWRMTNYTVRNRAHKVVAGLFQTAHEAIIAAKMLEEQTAKVYANLNKTIAQLMADELDAPISATPKLH